jgi:hypothetical protein
MDPNQEDRKKPGRKKKPALIDQDIQGLKFFKVIEDLLEPLHSHADCPNRNLCFDHLASLVLLFFLNPVLTSLRSIQQATGLRKVQRKLNIHRASLGSLSESAHVFDPELLGKIFQELAGRTEALDAHSRPPGLSEELQAVALDGSLLPAIPRMVWAVWLDKEHRAAKLHLEYDILKGIPKIATVTKGTGNEKNVLRKHLDSGKLYVLDAGYGEYKLMEEICQAKSSFVMRLHDNAVYEILKERPLSEADLNAGVVFDREVQLGSASKQKDLPRPVRVIQVHVKSPSHRGLARRKSKVSSKKTFRHRPEEYDLLIATDLMDCPAETMATMYRYRWTVELFFRWFKCVLGFKHLIFESERGVKILVYCALIVSLLITLWTGRKPTKRTLEMIQLYFQGWAEIDELEDHIANLKKRNS